MQRLIALVGLQFYAIVLTIVQYGNGVRTDEAKYLLDIPYPHPPLVRWPLSRLDWLRGEDVGFVTIDQELLVRLLFATLMAHAAWIVWDMGRNLPKAGKVALCMLWLGSAALVTQAGTVMMAPLTALETLAFLWILSLPKERMPGAPAIAFLWLLTLFTALQGVLLAPLAIAALRLKGTPFNARLWYVGAPLLVLGLYVLTNPLIPASFVLLGGDAVTPAQKVGGFLWMLVLAGSGVGTVAGIVGLAHKRKPFLLTSFVLVALYALVAGHGYYAILFLPFFVTGAKHLLRRMPAFAVPLGVALVACTVLLLAFHAPLLARRSPARYVLHQLHGRVLLKGSFGHEWQYEALPGQNLAPYSAQLEPYADVIVCFDDCAELEDGWVERDGGLANTWWRMARGDH